MTTIVEFNSFRRKANLPLVRFDLRTYSEQDLLDLREAFEALYAITESVPTDPRGYWAVARGHGYDQEQCHTNPSDFLTWHRSYLYMFERNLISAFQGARQDDSLFITLPYWDWTTYDQSTDASNGLPNAVNDAQYERDGAQLPNPLNRAKSLYRQNFSELTGDEIYTTRSPAALIARIPQLDAMVKGYMSNNKFPTFNQQFDAGAHGAIHVFVSGDMGRVVSAAFDPIFWLHHAMVDKVWFDWQARFGDSTVPHSVQSAVIYGGLRGRDVLDPENGKLRYSYSRAGVGVPATAAVVPTDDVAAATLPSTMEFDLGRLPGGFDSARLDFQGLKPPSKSYELRVFLNTQARPDASTALDGNPDYAGSLYLFGHGPCIGGKGHCNPSLAQRDEYDLRQPHHYSRKNASLDVTEALTTAIGRGSQSQTKKVNAAFVVVDDTEQQVPPNEIDFDSISLTTR